MKKVNWFGVLVGAGVASIIAVVSKLLNIGGEALVAKHDASVEAKALAKAETQTQVETAEGETVTAEQPASEETQA